MRTPPKILYWDIETSQNLVAVFQLAHNDWIDPSAIVRERYVICASWLWAGERKVHSISVLDNPKQYAKNPYDDKHVLQALHKVLSEADILISHNGDKFDKKYVDTRMLVHNLPRLPPILSIDTYKIAKANLLLNSNKLDYIGKLLNVGRKKHTTTGLWMRILQGDKKAIHEMVAYNKQDVLLLERVYLKLQPFAKDHVNRQLYGGTGCPRCGSTRIQARGIHKALTRTYQRFQCQTCGGWHRQLKPATPSTSMRVL
jgi:RNase H-like protein